MANESVLTRLSKRMDLFVPIAVMGIIMIMILPVHPFLLDIFLTLSVTVSVVVLFISIFVEDTLDFSTFPSVLLIVTLFRLALNIATTRRILLYGVEGEDAAGSVIMSFGQFVVGGDYVVGMIIFIILVIINFMVITKGSGRVAEVAARFTLDAMPGKQMSIDADLNAGIIDDKTARKMRADLQKKADFYGSMDGASKFVRGDAVAGLIITFINIVAGLIIGVVSYDMTVVEAAKRFTILTVGDGLVSQIPALIISTAAGIVVTRSGEEKELNMNLVEQLFKSYKVLNLTGWVMLVLGIIPGLPKLPFFIISAILLGISYSIKRGKDSAVKSPASDKEDTGAEAPSTEDEDVKSLLEMDVMELEIGFNLIALVDPNQGGTLLGRIKSVRRQIALEMGIIVPPIRIRDNLQIDSNGYIILIKGVKVASGSVMIGKYLAMGSSGNLDLLTGINTKEPAFGIDAKWVDEDERDRAIVEGFTVVDPTTVIVTHLTEIIKSNAHEILGRQELQDLLNKIKEKSPKLVDDLVPGILDLGIVHRVVLNLLRERISIRNLPSILETLATYGVQNKDVDLLTERVRYVLRRQIIDSLLSADGTLYLFTLNSSIEQMIAKNIQMTEDGREVVMDPAIAQKILAAIISKVDETTAKGIPPIIVISPPIRIAFRRFVEKFVKNINVISHNEITDNVRLESLGTLEIDL
ncbi:MAG: flagellar biosynthesis protein FlhA [Calditerrivibrio sp.]|nr:flagellar biosynthesis protein FlhA [Calditerrivibrio sp.]MCA1980433.1 flagellar biosynthesis protein FlhA [Calditerrivibrio sp.]